MEKGNIVRFIQPLNEHEKTALYVLLDDPAEMLRDNGAGYAHIQFLGNVNPDGFKKTSLAFSPISTVKLSDIEPITDWTTEAQ